MYANLSGYSSSKACKTIRNGSLQISSSKFLDSNTTPDKNKANDMRTVVCMWRTSLRREHRPRFSPTLVRDMGQTLCMECGQGIEPCMVTFDCTPPANRPTRRSHLSTPLSVYTFPPPHSLNFRRTTTGAKELSAHSAYSHSGTQPIPS